MAQEKLPSLPLKAFAKQPPSSPRGPRLVGTMCWVLAGWQHSLARHCVREKGAWRSEGPGGMLAWVPTQTLSEQPGWGSRWLLAPSLLTRVLTPAPFRPASDLGGQASRGRARERQCWMPALGCGSFAGSPLHPAWLTLLGPPRAARNSDNLRAGVS